MSYDECHTTELTSSELDDLFSGMPEERDLEEECEQGDEWKEFC